MKKHLTGVKLNAGINRRERALLKTARDISSSFGSCSLKEMEMKLKPGVTAGLLNKAAYMAALEFLANLPEEHDVGDSLCDYMGGALDAYVEEEEQEDV